MQQWVEALKSVVIGLLILLAVLLTAIISGYGSADALFRGLQPAPMDAIPLNTERTLVDGSQPLVISVKSEQGRTSFYHDFVLLDSAYEAMGSFLAQALDTAENPVELQQASFYAAATNSDGVYFRYPAAVALPTLTLWLDGESDVDIGGKGYFLQVDGEIVRLFVEGERCYSMLTEVDGEALQRALEGYSPDGTVFAQEVGKGNLHPLTLLSTAADQVLAATATNPCDTNFLLEVAGELLFNPYGESKYVDEQGGTVFTESDCTLRVGTDGLLTLENWEQTNRFTATSGAQADQIEYVSVLLSWIFQETSGEDRLMFTGYEVDDTINRVYFDYYLDGTLVTNGKNHSVVAEFQGKTLLSLQVRVRRYETVAETYLTYLPVEQAAALAGENQEMELAYGDLSGEELTVGWIS
ncbi:MAG: hypothetical protein R3Y62_04385 [Eubacteriales bacterium]